MARNIALELTLNGVQKSISSLQEFEKELLAVQEELGIMSADSTKAFDTVSTEISQVNKDFEMLSQNISDVDFTNTVDQFTQVGDSITDTFGQAQGAIQEFGNETKDVGAAAEKAMDETKKSAGGLSGALKDMGEKFQAIPGPVGQVAQSISGLAQGFKILIANPIGLFLAGIAVVFTTLYKALTSTEKGLFAFRELMAALSGVINPVVRLLQDIAMVLVDGVLKGITLVQNGLEKLGFGVFAQASRDAKELARSINEVEDAEGDLNVARAKQNKELAEAREIISDTNLALSERQAALQRVKKSEEDLAEREVKLAEQRLKNVKEEIKQKGASLELNDKEEQTLIQLYNTQQNQAAVRRKNIKAEQALTREAESEAKRLSTERAQKLKEASDKRKAQIEEETKKALEAIQLEIDAAKLLVKTISAPVPEPRVITVLNESLSVYKSLTDTFKTEKPFAELFSDFQKLPPPIEEAGEKLDKFGETYQKYRKTLSTAALSTTNEFKKVSKDIGDTFFDLFTTGEITKEAFDAYREIEDGYRILNKNINQINQDGLIFDPEIYYGFLRDLKVASGEIIFDLDKEGNKVSAITSKTYKEALDDFTNYETSLLERLFNVISESDPKAPLEKRIELSKQLLANIRTTSDSIIKEEENIENFYNKSILLQEERQKGRTQAFIGLLNQNISQVINEVVNQVGLAEGAAEDAFQQLVEGSIDTTKLTEKEFNYLLQVYAQFYQGVKALRKEDTDDEKKAQKEKREAILSNISSLSSALGEASSILSSFSSLALERLAAEEEAALDSIVGTNEQANQKRIELAQQYEGQRQEIEKQTRIQELEFARIQAIAEGAVAIIRAASTPILLPITTALVAAQVGLISAQIGQARSLQRGGLLQMGGLLEGPSHEQGGIRLGQMGIELEGGEAVINRVSTAQYGSLLSTINQAGGGRPLVNSFDDSRLLEALAKQRSEPIRAYVLEQEITNKQAVSTRLEALSTL